MLLQKPAAFRAKIAVPNVLIFARWRFALNLWELAAAVVLGLVNGNPFATALLEKLVRGSGRAAF